jgi:hypothetical protein
MKKTSTMALGPPYSMLSLFGIRNLFIANAVEIRQIQTTSIPDKPLSDKGLVKPRKIDDHTE